MRTFQRNLLLTTACGLMWIGELPTGLGQPLSDPPFEMNETCQQCHGKPEKLKTDFKDPNCLECHSATDLPAGQAGLLEVEDDILPVSEKGPISPRADALAKASLSSSQSTEMVYIPPGEFLMGSDGRAQAEGSGDPDEAPLHKVYLDGYYVDKQEVTNAEYKVFVNATGRRPPKHWNGNAPPAGKADHPVMYVDWFEANEYCHWVGKRLPTEEEWEKAARGTDGRRFPWGNTFDPMKANTPQHWLALNRAADTTPVGSFENGKSPYGLYDMAGNVYEWTSSWYKPYPHNRVANVHYGEKNKVVRGGSWYDCLSYGCGLSSPSFNRSRFAPAIRNKSFGFRCVKSE